MPDRRTFLIACGSVVVTPALAQFSLPVTGDRLPAAVIPSTLTLKVDGWEPHTGNEPEAWIHISASWRAAWR